MILEQAVHLYNAIFNSKGGGKPTAASIAAVLCDAPIYLSAQSDSRDERRRAAAFLRRFADALENKP